MAAPRPARRRQLAAGLLLSAAAAAAAAPPSACDGDHPTSPTMTFHYLDTVNITYGSSYPNASLYAMCNGEAGGASTITEETAVAAPPDHDSVLFTFNFQPPNGSVCWLELRPNATTCIGYYSFGFAVLASEGSHETFALSQAPSPPATAPASTSLPATTATSAGTAAAAAATTSSASGDGGGVNRLSTGAQVGLVFGVSIAVGLLVGGVVALICLRRQKRWRWPRRNIGANSNGTDSHNEKPQPLLLYPDWRGSHGGGGGSGGISAGGFTSPSPSSAGANSFYPSVGSQPSSHEQQQQQTVVLDDAYYVGWSSHLPGFYGSARESGSKHDLGSTTPQPPLTSFSAGRYQPIQSMAALPDATAARAGAGAPTTLPVGYYDYPYLEVQNAAGARRSHEQLQPQPQQPSAEPSQQQQEQQRELQQEQQQQQHQTASAELPGSKDSYRGYGEEFELSAQQSQRRRQQPYIPAGRDQQEQKFLLQDMELLGLRPQRPAREPG